MMPLSLAKTGDVNYIQRISGRDEVRQHLSELGFVVGEKVEIVNEMGGNLIINVKGTRVALGRQMANRIMV